MRLPRPFGPRNDTEKSEIIIALKSPKIVMGLEVLNCHCEESPGDDEAISLPFGGKIHEMR